MMFRQIGTLPAHYKSSKLRDPLIPSADADGTGEIGVRPPILRFLGRVNENCRPDPIFGFTQKLNPKLKGDLTLGVRTPSSANACATRASPKKNGALEYC